MGTVPEDCSVSSLKQKCFHVRFILYNFICLHARKIGRGPCGLHEWLSEVLVSTREEMMCRLKLNSEAANPCGQEFKCSVKRKKYSE